MKKLCRFRCLIIIMGFSIAFMCSGCSDQYKMERMVWHADQAAKPILINEGAVPSFELNRVLGMYEAIVEKKPDSGFAIDAKFKMATLYIADKSYDKARQVYDQIIIDYEPNKELVANAMFSKGQVYQLEEKWDEALKVFSVILKDHKQTSQGLSVPLYIARYYMAKEDTVLAVKSYQSAIEYFQNMADEYPNTKAALLCENLIVRSYMEMNAWEEAISYIESLDKKYKIGPDTLMVMAQIYKDKIGDLEKTEAIYERILRDFPDHQVASHIRNQRIANSPSTSLRVNE